MPFFTDEEIKQGVAALSPSKQNVELLEQARGLGISGERLASLFPEQAEEISSFYSVDEPALPESALNAPPPTYTDEGIKAGVAALSAEGKTNEEILATAQEQGLDQERLTGLFPDQAEDIAAGFATEETTPSALDITQQFFADQTETLPPVPESIVEDTPSVFDEPTQQAFSLPTETFDRFMSQMNQVEAVTGKSIAPEVIESFAKGELSALYDRSVAVQQLNLQTKVAQANEQFQKDQISVNEFEALNNLHQINADIIESRANIAIDVQKLIDDNLQFNVTTAQSATEFAESVRQFTIGAGISQQNADTMYFAAEALAEYHNKTVDLQASGQLSAQDLAERTLEEQTFAATMSGIIQAGSLAFNVLEGMDIDLLGGAKDLIGGLIDSPVMEGVDTGLFGETFADAAGEYLDFSSGSDLGAGFEPIIDSTASGITSLGESALDLTSDFAISDTVGSVGEIPLPVFDTFESAVAEQATDAGFGTTQGSFGEGFSLTSDLSEGAGFDFTGTTAPGIIAGLKTYFDKLDAGASGEGAAVSGVISSISTVIGLGTGNPIGFLMAKGMGMMLDSVISVNEARRPQLNADIPLSFDPKYGFSGELANITGQHDGDELVPAVEAYAKALADSYNALTYSFGDAIAQVGGDTDEWLQAVQEIAEVGSTDISIRSFSVDDTSVKKATEKSFSSLAVPMASKFNELYSKSVNDFTNSNVVDSFNKLDTETQSLIRNYFNDAVEGSTYKDTLTRSIFDEGSFDRLAEVTDSAAWLSAGGASMSQENIDRLTSGAEYTQDIFTEETISVGENLRKIALVVDAANKLNEAKTPDEIATVKNDMAIAAEALEVVFEQEAKAREDALAQVELGNTISSLLLELDTDPDKVSKILAPITQSASFWGDDISQQKLQSLEQQISVIENDITNKGLAITEAQRSTLDAIKQFIDSALT